ncbi:hypothetical protein PTTG_01965 [Puccinia triticina 1-1 BBBD Race 1]|uniref:Pyr_redox_2 domain-containing protein n=1 Tax=Puccinia triticina (isolate 1-1 / race 1 (BBBD)) TaxID=630390 RepID=A0A180G8L2_PUCT1|nr:hypothetical protein PTTG_01965 [Puccinia triticina 1-1 BBBD Race 1]
MTTSSRSVLVIGGSYAGLHAAELLAQQLPSHWSVTLVERNTHFNHVYSFPRSAVAGQAHRNFIPYTGKLNKLNNQAQSDSSLSGAHPKIRLINASVTKIVDRKVFLDRMVDLQQPLAHPLSSPAHEPIHALSSSVLADSPAGSVVTDSGYASSVTTKSPTKGKHQLASAQSIEQIGNPPADRAPQQTFQVGWDFLVYALGSHMPPPLHLPINQHRSKLNGVAFLEAQRAAIAAAEKIVIVGGGALGIQYACDIAHRYQLLGQPKHVTLIHSRPAFLPTFKPEIGQKVKQALADFGVHVVLGERVNLAKLHADLEIQKKLGGSGKVVVESVSNENKHWEADLVLTCTGQVPNTSLMSQFCPLAVLGGTGSSGLIRVTRGLQISPSRLGPSPVETPTGERSVCECGLASLQISSRPVVPKENPVWKRVFAIGDCVDGFGAIKAGHVGWNQAEVAARNILASVAFLERNASTPGLHEAVDLDQVEFEQYVPSPPMIKLTLGLHRVVTQLRSAEDPDELVVAEKTVVPDPESNDPGQTSSAWRDMWGRYDLVDEDQIRDGWA